MVFVSLLGSLQLDLRRHPDIVLGFEPVPHRVGPPQLRRPALGMDTPQPHPAGAGVPGAAGKGQRLHRYNEFPEFVCGK